MTRERPAYRTVGRLLMVALLLASVAGGCVQRRMTIRSNPPGAMVYVDNYEIGTTPVSTDFVYYGQREFRLVKDGYETLTVTQWVPPPWYEYFPLDFVAENVVPWEIRDERGLDFQMTPQLMVPTQQLLSRGENLRQTTQQQAPVVVPTETVPQTPALLPPP